MVCGGFGYLFGYLELAGNPVSLRKASGETVGEIVSGTYTTQQTTALSPSLRRMARSVDSADEVCGCRGKATMGSLLHLLCPYTLLHKTRRGRPRLLSIREREVFPDPRSLAQG